MGEFLKEKHSVNKVYCPNQIIYNRANKYIDKILARNSAYIGPNPCGTMQISCNNRAC